VEVWSQPADSPDEAPAGVAPAGVLPHTYLVGPPVVVDDRVYVAGTAAHRGIEVYLFAFDRSTGEPIWERYLCSLIRSEVPDDRASRPMAPLVAPLAAQGRRLFLATSVGAIAAIDAHDGRILWLSRTDDYPGKGVQTLEGDPRRIHSPALAAPIVRDDRLHVLATDAALGPLRVLDAETGVTETIFEARSPNFDHRYLLGVDEVGWAYLSGRHTLALCPDPSGREKGIAWRTPDRPGLARSRGGVGARFVYDRGWSEKSAGSVLFRLDRATGAILEEIVHPDGRPLGNVLTVARPTFTCSRCGAERIDTGASLVCPCGKRKDPSARSRISRLLISVSGQEICVLEGNGP
jgi:hypothetical protein